MAYRNNKWGYNPQQNENEKQQQLLIQKQKSLHKMKTALDTFYNTLEPLEEYIEKAGYYSDFQSRRQRYRKTISDSEGPVENDEDLFLSNLHIFAQLTVKGKPEFFREVIRGDFYRWINHTGITAGNCPETLKHFLIEINNVLDDKSEKIIAETDRGTIDVEINPKEMVGIFAGLQNPLSENRQQKKELEGKSWNELPEEDRLEGDADLGKQAFEEIERSVSIPHQNFRLRYFGKKRPTQQEQMNMEGIESSASNTQTNREGDDIIIDNEVYEPTNIQLDQEQVDIARQQYLGNNAEIYVPVGIGFIALISAIGYKVFKKTSR